MFLIRQILFFVSHHLKLFNDNEDDWDGDDDDYYGHNHNSCCCCGCSTEGATLA